MPQTGSRHVGGRERVQETPRPKTWVGTLTRETPLVWLRRVSDIFANVHKQTNIRTYATFSAHSAALVDADIENWFSMSQDIQNRWGWNSSDYFQTCKLLPLIPLWITLRSNACNKQIIYPVELICHLQREAEHVAPAASWQKSKSISPPKTPAGYKGWRRAAQSKSRLFRHHWIISLSPAWE